MVAGTSCLDFDSRRRAWNGRHHEGDVCRLWHPIGVYRFAQPKWPYGLSGHRVRGNSDPGCIKSSFNFYLRAARMRDRVRGNPPVPPRTYARRRSGRRSRWRYWRRMSSTADRFGCASSAMELVATGSGAPAASWQAPACGDSDSKLGHKLHPRSSNLQNANLNLARMCRLPVITQFGRHTCS